MWPHKFLLEPGYWRGKGKITLNMVKEDLSFATSWNVLGKDISGKIQSTQDILIEGLSEEMKNTFQFFDFANGKFQVELENPNLGKVCGYGFFDEKTISWEFREADQFEGFESYKKLEEGRYHLVAEYMSTDQLRTQIEAEITLDTGAK